MYTRPPTKVLRMLSLSTRMRRVLSGGDGFIGLSVFLFDGGDSGVLDLGEPLGNVIAAVASGSDGCNELGDDHLAIRLCIVALVGRDVTGAAVRAVIVALGRPFIAPGP